MHDMGTSTVSGLTGQALLKEWKAMQQSAAAVAAYWDTQPGQHHPRSFTAAALPPGLSTRAMWESIDGSRSPEPPDSNLTAPATMRAKAAALKQPLSPAGNGRAAPGSPGGRIAAASSEELASAVMGPSAEQKVLPSERLKRPSLTALFADLPAPPPCGKRAVAGGAGSAPAQRGLEKQEHPHSLPQMPSGTEPPAASVP